MGNQNTQPRTLSSRTPQALAEYVEAGRATKIVVLSGAGISTSAGIPDFRSPETGLYANLAKLDLPFAEAVFDISYFRQNPEPFYRLAHELYPGKYRPTITHSFIRLLHEKGLLLKHFTQNIDCLDREAGVPDDKIIEAHGSFAKQSCIDCKNPYPEKDMREHVANKIVPHCQSCNGLVKPEVVFFGEALPREFFQARDLLEQADLAIVMGSSLTVHPFASLPQLVNSGVPRVLINKDPAGELGSRADDVVLIGDCDTEVRKLAEACGWLADLEALWKKTEPKTFDQTSNKETPERSHDEQLEDEVDKLTKEIDESLRLSSIQNERIRKEVDDNNARLQKAESRRREESSISRNGEDDRDVQRDANAAGHLHDKRSSTPDPAQSKPEEACFKNDSDRPKM